MLIERQLYLGLREINLRIYFLLKKLLQLHQELPRQLE